MRRYITLAVVLIVVGVGVYIGVFKRKEIAKAAKGYKTADTPQVAADMFKKAVEAREYEYAAEYCTQEYADQLRRGNESASAFGTALDNLIYQMKERDLIRDETKVIFYKLDPFPKDITITVSKESGDTAVATIAFAVPASTADWKLDDNICQVFVRPLKFTGSSTTVGMKKDKGGWKFDFQPDNTLPQRVARMNDKYKRYVNPFEIIGQEVKNEPSTRENVTPRLKKEIESAAKE
jgi:hypothetical protein